ncbi:MAG: lyase family protein [Planctomycetota bacterium]
MTSPSHGPVWDRGDPIDPDMLAFTIGDDPAWDRRLVPFELAGSVAHVRGLARAGLLRQDEADALVTVLDELGDEHRRGSWTVRDDEEDVHSAVERRVTERLGPLGAKLHTGRSRNEEIALDLALWLRSARAEVIGLLDDVRAALAERTSAVGATPLPGYTHLRRAMPSTVGDWLGAHARAFELDADDVRASERRASRCPLGSGAGYGVPLPLEREYVAELLEFDAPETPVTVVQHARGRAELAYVTALEAIALDVGKLAADLWLFTTSEFGFARLPVALTTGSSLMPHKRNPDLVELLRAHARQVVGERQRLLDVLRDLPSGYHRDFQLLKPPLFGAHDRIVRLLPLVARLLRGFELDHAALAAAMDDPALEATRRALDAARLGTPFREAFVAESRRANDV